MAKFAALKTNSFDEGLDNKIASNSLVIANGDPVTLVGGNFITKATVGTKIVGVSVTDKTFASNNQTVANDVVYYRPSKQASNTYRATISGGTINATKVGMYYGITAGGVVDGTTESATIAVGSQVRLEVYESATSWQFSIV